MDTKQAIFDEDSKNDVMNLMSRTLAVYGSDVMSKLLKLRVLVVGLRGVGLETAKNLILAGPGSVTLYDNGLLELADLQCNFYATAADVGKKRSVVSRAALAQLNPYVEVQAHTGELNEHFIANFHAVVFTDETPRAELIKFSDFCHNHQTRGINPVTQQPEATPAPIAFFLAKTNGVASSIFTDFGPEHIVNDSDGLPNKSIIVELITQDGVVTISEAPGGHGLDDGSHIKFEEVQGMSELNTAGPIRIKRLFKNNPQTKRKILIKDQFLLDPEPEAKIDIASFKPYTKGGIITQFKMPRKISFQAFSQQLLAPSFIPLMNTAKASTSDILFQLHFARLAVWEFQERHGTLPKLHDEGDAKKCIAIADEILKTHKQKKESDPNVVVVENIDAGVIRQFCLYYSTELPGFCAFIGGIIAQEVIKIPGKFTPLRQWFHHEDLSLLQPEVPKDAIIATHSRYDHQVSIFGAEFQAKLAKQKWFLIGAGALGCEYLKGFAMMGVGASKEGEVRVTDMDTVDVSNLSRQFLFRRENVGQPKSAAASEAIRKMNPDINIKVFQTAADPKTEDTFDDAFWESLNGICNALDNIKARKYSCSKCVFHEKPLLESGTLGTMANSEVILPHLTDIYNQKETNDEDNIPQCTLHNFPYFIEHCITWARAQFNDTFESAPLAAQSFLKDSKAFFASLNDEGNVVTQKEKLQAVLRLFDLSKDITFEKCVELAVNDFTSLFEFKIRDLTFMFPENAVTAEGSLFWSGHKRFPQAAVFDPNNNSHLDFVIATANLYAFIFELPPVKNAANIREIASKVKATKWKPPSGPLNIDVDEKKQKTEEKKVTNEDVDAVIRLKAELSAYDVSKKKIATIQFEKDNDDNFHIDFIAACANLRAFNYNIKQASRHQIKIIAGKIIPAIATSTALITGLNCIELYKIILNRPKKDFLNSNVNLAVNQLSSWEPDDVPKTKSVPFDVMYGGPVVAIPEGFTVWDKIIVDKGDLTIEGLCQLFPQMHYGCEVQGLAGRYSAGDIGASKLMYSTMSLGAELTALYEKNKSRNIVTVFIETYGPPPSKNRNYLILDISGVDANLTDAKVPIIKYIFKTPFPN